MLLFYLHHWANLGYYSIRRDYLSSGFLYIVLYIDVARLRLLEIDDEWTIKASEALDYTHFIDRLRLRLKRPSCLGINHDL